MDKNYRPEKYYLGFDIGTNSVGWAVTDADYRLCRFKGKDMWGIRLFEEANTAADRRVKRNNRRRLQRRRNRIDLLQMLFADEVNKIDPDFFIRLNESRLHLEDKSTSHKYVLFNDEAYSDIDYYKEYPTIYHLRNDLITDPKPHDIRLVYLALHHILKYRGHFLIDGALDNVKNFDFSFNQFIDVLSEELSFEIRIPDKEGFETILRNRDASGSDKAKALERLLKFEENDGDKETLKKRKASIKEICKLLAGNQGDIKKIFYNIEVDAEDVSTKFNLSDSKFDEEIAPVLEQIIPDEIYAVRIIKSLYDWSVLVDIMHNAEFFSAAKVGIYNEHKENLAELRYLIKKYSSKGIYKEFFDGKNNADNYAGYIGTVKTGGKKVSVKGNASDEDFYKNTKKILDSFSNEIKPEDEDRYKRVYEETTRGRLLPLLRSKSNSVVPKQVHEQELAAILSNASKYLTFLNDKDEAGRSVADKIKSIFNFRIPYYVGPLSDRHKDNGSNVWNVRKEDGYIYPWNIEEKIDFEKSNEKFIRRMTNKCTYLPWEDVLPKNSLLYQRYMVLNELNNLKIRGRSITVSEKQKIYHDLFEVKNKVKGSDLLTYLRKDDKDLGLEDLSGFDGDFKSSLSSYLDFKKKVFGDRINEDEIKRICEDIVRWATIYGTDSSMLEKVVRSNYGAVLHEDQIKAIKRLKYSGWGQFSKAFLCEIYGTDTETGEFFSILNAMWETNNNLMKLLSGGFTFTNEIDNLIAEHSNVITKISYDELVDSLYTSPANKRAIWQTIQIAEEVRKVMGKEPTKIFVEMARGGERKKKRTTSRKQKLIDLYEACEKDVREWALEDIKRHEERDFNSLKLYLYYTQMGRCAYTGEPIDLDSLMRGSSMWDRDHIYPQSRIKDDSIDNLVLAKRVKNEEKSNGMIPSAWQIKMKPTWQLWLDKGLISKEKYDRLTRKDEFSADELSGFVARQLVETRQSTKLVANLMERMYPDSKIVRVKAGLVSDFRKEPLKVLKSRRVNDFHHAKDAYLNIVVGNVYSVRFTDNPREWVKRNKDKDWSINKFFYFDVDGAWTAPKRERSADGKNRAIKNADGEVITGSIDLVRKTVLRNNVLYTERTYCETGELFNATLQSKGKAGTIPLKKGLNTEKYGGYISPNTSYFAQIEFDGKKGERVRNIVGVPIYVANMLENDKEAFLKYCKQVKGLRNVKVLVPVIKKNSLLVINGFPMRIRGENNANTIFKSNIQLLVCKEDEDTIRRIEKWSEDGRKKISEDFDGITDSDLLCLYDSMSNKLINGVYRSRPANQSETILKGRERFINLEIEEKAAVLFEMMNMFRCGNETKANLSEIGGSRYAGFMAINKNTAGKGNVILVNQSITGLYENKVKI